MKKRVIVSIALILVVALLTTVFVGCDEIFKKNETRDANQIVATVSYNGVSSNVYKFELESSFNSYAYMYVNYYGLSYEETAEYLVKSLAQQRLIVLYAREKVLEYMQTNHPERVNGLTYATATSKDLLSTAEVDHAIKAANESMLSSLKSIVKSAISEDNYNSNDTSSSSTKVTDPITVKFETGEGSEVEDQEIQKSSVAKAPTDPTRDDYTFYGWYLADDFSGEEFDFETELSADTTLYAKWEHKDYPDPRTVKEEAEEDEDDYDHDEYYDEANLEAKFFTEAYRAGLYDLIKDDDAIANMKVPETSTFEATLNTYINEGLATLKKNLVNNIHKDDFNACYDYYLNSQFDSLLIKKLERVIGESVDVSAEEVEKEFALALAQNKETFGASASAYSSALTSSLKTTYYHTATTDSYGFVINILLKLDDESVEYLNDLYVANNKQAEEITRIERNRKVCEMQVSVSNPDYDPEAKALDAEGNERELRDPMIDLKDETGYNENNDYDKILEFKKNDETGEYEIVYNVHEHPAMPYLLNKVYAFDTVDDQSVAHVGIIHQINNSFKQVKDAADLSNIEKVCWLREVATAWLYLVGDDSGAVTSSSNNNGLGYLITPEGEASSYLADFTTYARALVARGTGAYQNVDAVDASLFQGADGEGNLAGDGKTYVVADNLGSSSAYAGVFVLLASDRVWDENVYTIENTAGERQDNESLIVIAEEGVLPMNYVLEYAKDLDDVKTVYDLIRDSLLEGKKSDAYSAAVNAVIKANEPQYFQKVYKSLYEKLD